MGAVAVYALVYSPASTETAVANGDTRTLSFVNNHTHESESFTFRANGYYDQAVLDKLNWFMRDWRINEQIKMDPRLFDILWDVYRQSGSSQPIDVLSAYRSPQTNAMLRRRSRLVARQSQHMQGKAMDAHFIDVRPGPIRDIAMRMQEGGVGFYPIGATPWVHIDSGTVRYWPRMSRGALARLFPDGKTVFIPSDGQPMSGYAEAKAMIESRGGDVMTATASGGGLFNWLFGGARGGGADDEEESAGGRIIAGGRSGPPAMMGRGGLVTPVVAANEPSSQTEPKPILESTPPVVAENAPATRVPETDVTDGAVPQAPDPSPLVTSIAPLPPRKPAEFQAAIKSDAPLPPRRPTDFTIVRANGDEPIGEGDLIATLIKRKALPSPITKGLHEPPKSALAMVDPTTAREEPPEALARARALFVPPLPPRRPHPASEGVTTIQMIAPLPPPRPAKTHRPSAANPFGSLVVDAFVSQRRSHTEGPAPTDAGLGFEK